MQHRAGIAQLRPRYPLEPLRAPQRRPRSASQCPRVAPGEAQALPGRGPVRPGTAIESPRGGREHAEATNFTAKLPPESKISSFVRASRSESSGVAICHRILSFFGVFANRANPLKYRTCQQKQGFGPSHCTSTRLREATSKNNENLDENRRKIEPKSASRSLWRPFRSTFVGRS